MYDVNQFTVINIRKYLQNNEELGEDELNEILSEFSCPKNSDVEKFLKKSAIEFTKKNQSVTYLVFSNNTAELVGYFALTIKPIEVNSDNVSKKIVKKISRVGEYDDEIGSFHLAAYLIAQLGKNFTACANEKIKGKQLLEIAIMHLKELQFRLGGTVVFLETEENEALLNFYTCENGFQAFRVRSGKSHESQELVRMIKVL